MNRKIKIAHISSHDNGGAGSAALWLDQYCKKNGFDSTLYIKGVAYSSSSERITGLKNRASDFFRRVVIKFTKLLIDNNYLFYGMFDSLSELPDDIWKDKLADKDIIFIYWISTFTTLTQLARVLSFFPEKKIYIVNFDMANMTGGCHYSFGCDQFTKGCRNCPAMVLPIFKNFVSRVNMDKTIAIAKMNAKSLSFTHFVHSQAASASVNFTDNYLFSLPVNSSEFRPTTVIHNRTIFIGAYSPQDKRKGFDLLCRILLVLSSKLTNKDKILQPITLLFPTGTELPDYLKNKFAIDYYNYADSSSELNAIYNRASLFLNTTLDDSGPVMVLQAMLAGLPVVSHRIGYAADMIKHDENGYLVNYLDVNDFVHSILSVLDFWTVNDKLRQQIHLDSCSFLASLPQFREYLT
ncbi:glycosyltransferase [Aeromonas hydrophila]|uniref:glycosyltransferase n=1 Tax=Aeromonas hydrophila TaxID=644 RepID=UPI00403E40E4